MPRGNPNFGRDVKSPGRPKKAEKDDTGLAAAQQEVDEFLQSNVMKYIKAQHQIALDEKADKKTRLMALQNLTDRAVGKVGERNEKGENALVGLVRELIGLGKPKPVLEGEFTVIDPKELPSGEPQPA